MIGIASVSYLITGAVRGATSMFRPRAMPVSLHAGEKEIIISVAQSLLDVGGVDRLKQIGNVAYPVGGDGRLLGGSRRSKWGLTLITADITDQDNLKVAHVLFDFSNILDLADCVETGLANISEGWELVEAEKAKLRAMQASGDATLKYCHETPEFFVLVAILNLKALKKHERNEYLGRGR